MSRMWIALLTCAALAMGGCGGDDDDDAGSSGAGSGATATATTAAPGPADRPRSKTEYVRRANRICSDIGDEQEQYQKRVDALDSNDLPQRAEVVDDALKTTRKSFARFRALQPPTSDQALVGDYIAAVDRLLASRDRLVEAARANDREAGRQVSADAERLDDRADRLGKRLGLDACEQTF